MLAHEYFKHQVSQREHLCGPDSGFGSASSRWFWKGLDKFMGTQAWGMCSQRCRILWGRTRGLPQCDSAPEALRCNGVQPGPKQACVTITRRNKGTNGYQSALKFAVINVGEGNTNRRGEKHSNLGKRHQYLQSVGYRNTHLCVCFIHNHSRHQ